VLVFAQLYTQQGFGVVGGGLEILGDRTLTPRNDGEQKNRHQQIRPTRCLVGDKRFAQRSFWFRSAS
jgi:hypothetical protein